MTQQDMATHKQKPIPAVTLRSEQTQIPWPAARDNAGGAFVGYSPELVLSDLDARPRSRNGRSPAAAETLPAETAAPTEPLSQIVPPTLPLSIAQRGIWVAQKIGSVGAVFNIAENI